MHQAHIKPIVSKLRTDVLAVLNDQVRESTLADLEAGRRERLASARRRPKSPAERAALLRQEEMARLHKALDAATEALDRHFIYLQLEECLYKSRSDNPAALLDYEKVCDRHHAEIDAIRLAFLEQDGYIPQIPIYRQMAILKYKSKDFKGALAWAERGIAMYGASALVEKWVIDLKDRATTYRDRAARDD